MIASHRIITRPIKPAFKRLCPFSLLFPALAAANHDAANGLNYAIGLPPILAQSQRLELSRRTLASAFEPQAEPSAATERYAYTREAEHDAFNITEVKDPNGHATTYTWNAPGTFGDATPAMGFHGK